MRASAWRSASNRAITCRVSMPNLTILRATRRRIGSVCSASTRCRSPLADLLDQFVAPDPVAGLLDYLRLGALPRKRQRSLQGANGQPPSAASGFPHSVQTRFIGIGIDSIGIDIRFSSRHPIQRENHRRGCAEENWPHPLSTPSSAEVLRPPPPGCPPCGPLPRAPVRRIAGAGGARTTSPRSRSTRIRRQLRHTSERPDHRPRRPANAHRSRLASPGVFLFEPRFGLVEQGPRPPLLEELVGGHRVGGFEPVAVLRRVVVQGKQGLAAPALLGLGFVPFVRQEVLQRGQQEGTKTALFALDVAEAVLLDKAGEELLREVLGGRLVVAPAPDVNVERIPIGAAELLQGGCGFRENPGRARSAPRSNGSW